MIKIIRNFFLTFACILLFSFHPLHAWAKTNRFYYEKKGDVIWEVSTKEKLVAITFDDGPHPVYTPQILDVLKQYHARATFFLVGTRMTWYPNIVKREVREGHELGNHTFTHSFYNKVSHKKFLDELHKTDKLISRYQKKKVKLFRSPGGTLTKEIINSSKDEGYKVIQWSWHQDPKDWSNPGVKSIVNHVINNVHNGDIILMHDSGGRRQQTVEALKEILPELKKRGYRFITVSELLEVSPKYKNLFENEWYHRINL